MAENPRQLPERMPSEPDPPVLITASGPKIKKTIKWGLSGFFNLKKLKGTTTEARISGHSGRPVTDQSRTGNRLLADTARH